MLHGATAATAAVQRAVRCEASRRFKAKAPATVPRREGASACHRGDDARASDAVLSWRPVKR